MATGLSSRELSTVLKPNTIVSRQRSRLLELEGSVIGSTMYSPPRIALNTILVPPASSVRTILESFLKSVIIIYV